jgi:hypothetical protein
MDISLPYICLTVKVLCVLETEFTHVGHKYRVHANEIFIGFVTSSQMLGSSE